MSMHRHPAPLSPTAAEHLALIADALHVPRDTPGHELVQLVSVRCRPMDRQHLDRLVTGSLKSAIHAHGPITHEGICSTARRMSGQIHAVLCAQHMGLDDPGQELPSGPAAMPNPPEDAPPYSPTWLSATASSINTPPHNERTTP